MNEEWRYGKGKCLVVGQFLFLADDQAGIRPRLQFAAEVIYTKDIMIAKGRLSIHCSHDIPIPSLGVFRGVHVSKNALWKTCVLSNWNMDTEPKTPQGQEALKLRVLIRMLECIPGLRPAIRKWSLPFGKACDALWCCSLIGSWTVTQRANIPSDNYMDISSTLYGRAGKSGFLQWVNGYIGIKSL